MLETISLILFIIGIIGMFGIYEVQQTKFNIKYKKELAYSYFTAFICSIIGLILNLIYRI